MEWLISSLMSLIFKFLLISSLLSVSVSDTYEKCIWNSSCATYVWDVSYVTYVWNVNQATNILNGNKLY